MRRAVSEDKDKSLIERKEKTRIHKELDTLEKNYMELTHQRKADLAIKQNEIDNLNKVCAQFEDQKNKLSNKVDSHETEFRDYKKKLIVKQDQVEMLEREFAKMQVKYREIQNHEFNLNTTKEQQVTTLKIQNDEIQKLTLRF